MQQSLREHDVTVECRPCGRWFRAEVDLGVIGLHEPEHEHEQWERHMLPVSLRLYSDTLHCRAIASACNKLYN